MDDFEADDEGIDGGPAFVIIEWATYYKRKNENVLFGDFYLKFIGEIVDGGFWVCSCGATVLGKITERRIVIPASAFDSKIKFLEKTRKSFGGGTFNMNEGGLLEQYYTFLKEEYAQENARQFYAANWVGRQKSTRDYWCLSTEVHVEKGKILAKEDQKYFFLDDSLSRYEVSVKRHLLQDNGHLLAICKRFIESCSTFGVNETSMKLATAFVLLRLLRIENEEAWNESSIGLLYSSSEERNVGKSLTMDLLAKGQGVATRSHPTMLAGGDQNQSGASVPVIRDTMTHTNIMVMVDDPVISTVLSEMLLQVNSGLTMGSRTGGVGSSPGGSLLLTSNSDVTSRAEGRVLVFPYCKGHFSSVDEKCLEDGVKTIASENTGFLLAWAIKFKRKWGEKFQEVFNVVIDELSGSLPHMQPRWCKGMAAVIATHAIFHALAGALPFLAHTIMFVLSVNLEEKTDDVVTRLERSLASKLQSQKGRSNVFSWLNPSTKVPVAGKLIPAIGIRSTTLEGFAQVSMKEVCAYLKTVTDSKSSISMHFAVADDCTVEDLQQRTANVKPAKGWKIPTTVFGDEILKTVEECCGLGAYSLRSGGDTCTTTSADTDSISGEVLNEDLGERVGNKFNPIDADLISYFKDYQEMLDQEPDEDLMPDFERNLTPNTKKDWDTFSPRSKATFHKGFEVARRILQNPPEEGCSSHQTPECSHEIPSDSSVQITGSSHETPGPFLDHNVAVALPRKRALFPEGTIGVLPRAKSKPSERLSEPGSSTATTEETKICFSCKKESPFKKKQWSGSWVQCDRCLDWYHLECTKLPSLPGKKDPWCCVKCQKTEKKKKKPKK